MLLDARAAVPLFADQYERLLTAVYEAARHGSLPDSLLAPGVALAS